ncbi:MAG TPA: RIP metalloprotease RseP [Xanthobacteraceae bacterium]|jgi:regulator of sigma E protease
MSFEFLSGINMLGSSVLGIVIPFLFVLTPVVFFHELGHFLVARRCGVKILVFSIGFGPELFGFNDRHGTRWKIAAIPLGGYVKFFGDENAASAPDLAAIARMTEEQRRESFIDQSVGRRAAIVCAGPLANFLLAIAIFASLFAIFGKPSTSPRVDSVQPGSAAEAAGFRPGDLVLSINGSPIDSFSDMQQIVSTSAGETLLFEVQRGDSRIELKAVPALKEVKDRFGNAHRQGILGITRSPSPEDTNFQPVGPLKALELGVQRTWFVVERTLSYIGGVISGREGADQLGGPIRIAQVSGQVATEGMPSLISLAAVLSVSIGLLNLFPVPLLDGGHLLFYGIEAVRGKPLSERAQEVGFRIGLAIVLMLMIFATYNDILHIAAQWTAS